MIVEMSVSQYCKRYNITRHATHRRIKKWIKLQSSVNNIVSVKKIGEKIIILEVDTSIRFKKREPFNI